MSDPLTAICIILISVGTIVLAAFRMNRNTGRASIPPIFDPSDLPGDPAIPSPAPAHFPLSDLQRPLPDNRRLSEIIDLLPDITFAIDTDGVITLWNKAAEEATGFKAREMIGKGNHEYAIPFYNKRRPVLIDLVFSEAMGLEKLYPMVRREGDRVIGESFTLSLKRGEAYMSAVAAPLYDAEGNVVGAIESVHDITDRKRAEEALKESEEKMRTLFQRARDAVLIIDNTVFIDCNDAAVKTFGYRNKAELLQCHPSSLSPAMQPDGRSSYEKAEDLLALTMEQGYLRFEWMHRRANGEDFPVEVTLTVIPFKGRKIMHVALRDIADRKRAEEALKESEEKFRTLFEHWKDGVLLVDNRMLADCNEAAVKMLKYKSKQELLNLHPSELSPPIQPDGRSSYHKAEEMMALALAKGSHRFEWIHRRADGEDFPVEVTLTAIMFKGRRILHAAWRDITSQKRAEEALKKYQEEESRVLAVSLMNLAMEYWSEATGKTKADLAQESKIWKVYINLDGWERTQTLDRYLDVKTLPAHPKWKKVVATVNFALASSNVDSPVRQALQETLDRYFLLVQAQDVPVDEADQPADENVPLILC